MSTTFSLLAIVIAFLTFFQNAYCQKSNDCLEYCEGCFRYFVVWEELDGRVMFFNTEQTGKQIQENLGCAFPEKVIIEDEIKLQLWYEEPIEGYFDVSNYSTNVHNNNKINIKEILHKTIEAGGNISNPNIKYPKTITTNKTEQSLRNNLFKFYDASVWPWIEMDSPCLVQTNIMFSKVIDVDLSQGSLSMLVWFRLRWNDPRFTWETEKWNGIEIVHLKPGEFWDPDIEFWNSLDSIEKVFQPQMAYVNYKGDMFWSRLGQIQISCNMKGLEKFPYDTSKCLIEVGSWAYDSTKVEMEFFENGYEIDISDTSTNNSTFVQYNINNVIVGAKSYPSDKFITYPQDNNPWPALQYNVFLRRNHPHYTYGIIIPQALLTLISFGAFWLPPSSGERISFTITIPLAIARCYGGVRIHIFFPWKSFKKLIIDMKENKYWVDVIKAIDVEMTHQKIQQNSGGLSSQIKKFTVSIRRPFSRNQQDQSNVQLSQQNLRSSQERSSQQYPKKNDTMQINNQNESANDLYATFSQQSDDFVNPYQRASQQVIQEETSSSTSTENFEDIEMQNITFPLQNVRHARIFLWQVLDNKQYEYARKSYRYLCERYSEQDVQRDLFRMMGIVDGTASDFGKVAKNHYNLKWRRLSNLVDRICQFIVFPAFVVFVFTISFQVVE